MFKRWSNQPGDWENYWSQINIESLVEKAVGGYLGEFEVILKYLPKDKPILEAGCGLGQLVLALQSRSYKVEGVDFSETTIQRMMNLVPEINLRVGDVNHLDVPDGYYGGYLSFGVLEHNPDGPDAGLREARRVLSPGGIAIISVPYINSKRARRLSVSQIINDEKLLDNNLSFYQYYFSKSEFIKHLEQYDLRVIDLFPYAVYAGLTRDFSLGRWLFANRFFSYRLREYVLDSCNRASIWVRFRYAHMMMYICQRI